MYFVKYRNRLLEFYLDYRGIFVMLFTYFWYISKGDKVEGREYY